MSDPFRLRVLKNLSALLETVNPDNGYTHDLRGAVFRGRTMFGASDPIPMISILEAPIPLEALLSRNTNAGSTGSWELLIQGFLEDDFQNPTDPGHLLMAEVKKAIAKEKTKERGRDFLSMKGGVTEIYVGQGSVRPADEQTDKAFFWLTLTLRLAENLLDPYA